MSGAPRTVDLGEIDSFPVGKMTIVTVNKVEIGILHWHNDRIYAIRNLCPHMKGPVCLGRVSALLTGNHETPGSYLAVDWETPVLACAWHNWEFNVETGTPIVQPTRYHLRTYPVIVAEGRVSLEIGGHEQDSNEESRAVRG